MDVEKTTIADVLHIRPKIWGDQRGFFVETWQQERYAAAGIRLPFVQDNHSSSTVKGTLRARAARATMSRSHRRRSALAVMS